MRQTDRERDGEKRERERGRIHISFELFARN